MDDWGRGKCTLAFDPPLAASTRGWVRAAVDGTVLASWNAQEMSGSLHTLGPATAWTTLPASDRVNTTTPTLMWEVSPDGEHWFPAGTSGPHTMYWTEAAPITDPFEAWGATYPEVFDRALDIACGGAAEASHLEPRLAIARKVDAVTTYYPAGGLGAVHPLSAVGRSDPNAAPLPACLDLSNLLRGVLRSAGIDAEVRVFFNAYFFSPLRYAAGSNGGRTFQAEMPAHDEVGVNPHFSYHAVVKVGEDYFDPSYALDGPLLLRYMTSVDPWSYEAWTWRSPPAYTVPFSEGSTYYVYQTFPSIETGLVCEHPETGCVGGPQ